MKDIIKALRVLAEELDKQCKTMLAEAEAKPSLVVELGAATFATSAYAEALKSSASRLESEPPKDGWIEWGGGDCPVADKTFVMIRTAFGDESDSPEEAAEYEWAHECGVGNIIAYRIVE